MPSSALVVGGGLAGIAAACDLSEAGWRVTLLERRRRLGGMVASFRDPGGAGEIDNGEHIAIEACRELYALFGRLGVGDKVRRQPRLSIPFLGPDGRRADLGESAWSFLSFRFLSFADRWRVARGISAIGRLKDAEIARLDNLTAREWLEDIGQTPEAIARFWEMFVCPALNEPCERASAALTARVLRDAMGRGPAESRFGLFTVPLGTILSDAATRWIGERGGEVRTLATAAKVMMARGRTGGVELTGGERIAADVVIVALPHGEMGAVLPDYAPPLGHSPIVNAHVFYDRPVTDMAFFGLVDCRVHWVFNRSVITGQRGPGQHLSCSISAAHDWAHRPSAEIAATCDAELKRRLKTPARLVRFVVSREHRATFSARPGTSPLRPGPRTRIPNLYLAGAWTDTGYPATMEGAVRSGREAARAARAGGESGG